ncbi:GNAT family N-acetyltransferase [Alkalilimnicola sp. S0819]|uniref:GNAT family N-acetyltransferase n=1 Tax=Alkalilimnicola sp. S0819 TaxID=2613922 RepID=UPI0018696ECF|nr:GNAT family N-acetyltransferase [Alkalilimnicola sp. S0819]
MELQVLDGLRDRPGVVRAWRTLVEQGDHAYFLSWGWMEAWLDTAASYGARPQLALFSDAQGPAAACFLGRRRRLRHGFIPARSLHLNSSGVPALDRICIEFNAVPCRPDVAPTLPALLQGLPGGWDELVLPGLDREAFPGASLGQAPRGYRLEVRRDTSAHYVDLAPLRAGQDYLALLSANTRAQIRRARRRYAERGEWQVEEAATLAEAEALFEQLLGLHRAMWAQRGSPSNFDTDYVLAFHRRLIRQRFHAGDIQLLRFSVDGEPVGCLYNFRHQGRVYAYQSGFRFESDNRLKPGLACHSAAVEHNARQGHRRYELLAGDGQYKASLATGRGRLLWCTLQKPRPQFWVERQARALRQALHAARMSRRGGGAVLANADKSGAET